MSTNSTISLRLPPELHGAVREIARRRGTSLNAFVVESLRKALEDAEKRVFFDSFTLLGEDAAESNVEYAVPAQAEVMLRGE